MKNKKGKVVMKKLFSLFLILVVVFSIGSVVVSAEEPTMTNNEQMLAALPTDIQAGEPADGSIYQFDYNIGRITTHLMFVLHETDATNENYVALKKFTDELVKDCTTDLEKVTTISQWVYKNVEYIYGMFAGNTVDTIYDVFTNKQGNCECKTRLTNYMLYLVGIPSGVITSDVYGHEWGCALVDGEWIIVDSTNDYIGNEYLEYKTIEKISFSTPDGLSYVVMADEKKVLLAGCGFAYGTKVDEVTIPSFVCGVEKNALKYFSEYACMVDNNDIVIQGEAGTYAETYALQNNKCISYADNQFTTHKKHSYIVKTIEKASCTHKGLLAYTCTECGDSYTKAVAKLSHTFKITSKKATYFENGYTSKKVCKCCGKVVSKGKVVKKLKLKRPSVKCAPAKKKVVIKYTKVNGATGFQVRYKRARTNKFYYKIFKTTKSATKYIKNLKKNQKYYIRIRSFRKKENKVAYSSWSSTRTIKTR